ncbi:hypothetical protein M9H77_16442 [Catharanthus roseus]|uniref:Uncharacterized protein n=1 Tax=Catharanthus roseus TaxID=4058 RepID=A0ACC0B1S1_CATRO|nr:hypothetical protein M9H77_16442 [Catharanthus roseus]
MRQFARAQHIPDACDTRLDLYRIQLRRNDHTYWKTQHASHVEAWVQRRLRVRDGPALAIKVYISNPANRDTRSVRYQPIGVDRRMMTSMLQEVDDMASMVIQEPPSSPSQMAMFAKKVQTIIRRYTLLTPPSQSFPSRSGTLQMPPPPGLGFAPFQSPYSTSFEFFGFRAPPPPSTAGSSTLHQPISQASSSDEEERTDDMDVVPHYGFGHRVGKNRKIHILHFNNNIFNLLNHFKIEAINPIRVMLFWDSKSARNAYGPYFIGTIRKSWTLPTSRIISHDELVRKILKYQDMDPNLWNVRMTMRVPSYYVVHPVTQMVFDEPSMLYNIVNNNDDEVDGSDGDDVSSQFESDDDNDPEEGEFQTPLNPVNPVNPVTENIVPQWESSQWSAALDMTTHILKHS